MVCLAPRALEEIMRPRRPAGVVARPLNFTVRQQHMERPAWVLDEEEWRANCRRLAAEAQGLVDGAVGVLEAARRIEDAGNNLRSPYEIAYALPGDCDADLTTFHKICNECLNFPSGAARQYWSGTALARVDTELNRIEEKWHERAVSAAKDLIAKYAVV